MSGRYHGLDAPILAVLREHPDGLTAEEIKSLMTDADLSMWDSAIRRMHVDGLIRRRSSDRKYQSIWVVP